MSKLDEIKDRLAKATPGPWATDTVDYSEGVTIRTVKTHRMEGGVYSGIEFPEVIISHGGRIDETYVEISKDNATFITNSPSDIQYLLDEVDRLREELECITYIHTGNPSLATADMPEADYANYMLGEARQVARQALLPQEDD
ncbi:MAG: hypothetical protein JKY52_08505 [Flavobacteriales bacterium]|nr:hypothetical protein [Flavobacteriales bacterium]